MAGKKAAEIVKWDEKFAKYAKETAEQVKSIGSGGIGVKFGRGTIAVGGTTVPGGKLVCVILGSCALNAWNKDEYDADNPQPPDCYAFSIISDDDSMKPHEKAPMKQSDRCETCDKNEYGSSKRGKGKACRNTIRLGLLTAKDVEDAEGISTAEMATASISPTNLKHYAGYVKALLADTKRPPWAVVTEISSHDDAKTQIRLEFKLVELIKDAKALPELEKRFLKIQEVLQQPFNAAAEKPQQKKKSSQKFAGKGVRK
jgi:hypothetical protein